MREKTYIIAEAGVNHNGSIELAKKLIDVAAEAGADAVKFQTFSADELVCLEAPKADYQKNTTDAAESQWQMLKKLELKHKDHQVLASYCSEKGIAFLSTPFDFVSFDYLVENFDMPYIKVSSGDLTNAPFLLKIAQSGKKIILSTGMATLGEIETALGVLAFGYENSLEPPSEETFHKAYISEEGQKILKEKVILLHCTTEYPAPLEDVNLKAMTTIKKAFSLAVGYSDHTEGIAIPIAAVAYGAKVIEKHFTLDRTLPGPDHRASLDPDELKQMVQAIHQVEQAMGMGIKRPSSIELKNRSIARKSLVTKNAIKAGELFSKDNIAIKRPGTGISPIKYWQILGKQAKKNYIKDELIFDE